MVPGGLGALGVGRADQTARLARTLEGDGDDVGGGDLLQLDPSGSDLLGRYHDGDVVSAHVFSQAHAENGLLPGLVMNESPNAVLTQFEL
jgi:hypothetical protein